MQESLNDNYKINLTLTQEEWKLTLTSLTNMIEVYQNIYTNGIFSEEERSRAFEKKRALERFLSNIFNSVKHI